MGAHRCAAADAQAQHQAAEDNHREIHRARAQRRADHEHDARQDQHALHGRALRIRRAQAMHSTPFAEAPIPAPQVCTLSCAAHDTAAASRDAVATQAARPRRADLRDALAQGVCRHVV